MLVLSRKRGDAIAIGQQGHLNHAVKVTVLEIRGPQVKLGFEAAGHIAVNRWEVWERIREENLTASVLPNGVTPTMDRWSDDGGV